MHEQEMRVAFERKKSPSPSKQQSILQTSNKLRAPISIVNKKLYDIQKAAEQKRNVL